MSAFYQLMNNMRPRFRHRLTQYWLLLLLCLVCAIKGAMAGVSDVDLVRSKAIKQAEELQLAQHDIWLALLHYKRETMSGRFISQADDDNFFLDKDGKTDPHAELVADITAFFRAGESGHAQCLFPARWSWLKQQLELSDEYDVACPQLDIFMQRMSHEKLFLVFPSMYLNNPGSTFGHTFMRFDGDDDSILLSQTLNYAARVDQSDAFVSYISKGLFGGYSGFFRARPYYETVQEYNNIENRDIWEYQLDYTADEIEQLVRHVWEVKGVDFDYYFFRENCSYRLLALLDVMRPGVQLTGEADFPVYAIPVDTVRALDDAGLILSRKFRASLATQIDDYFQLADDKKAAVVLQIIDEDLPADKQVLRDKLEVLSSDRDKLDVLKQAYSILQFSREPDSDKAKAILQLTNKLSRSSDVVKQTPVALHEISPEMGHKSLRVAVGYGQQSSLQYMDLGFRAAFHDLLDAPQGYVSGAAINIFDARFKWFVDNDSNNLRLESLSLFNVTSLSPVSQWKTPVSWLFDFRLDRTQMSATESARNFISRGGLGFSFKQHAVMPYVLMMGEWNVSSDYDKGYSLLLGLQAGMQLQLSNNQLVLSYQIDEAVSGFKLDRAVSQLRWQYNLQVNHALRVVYKRTEYDFFNDEDWNLNYQYYF